MKKLSVEEKAKRYDEAFEIARKINSGEGVEASPDWTIPEVIFHELRENEDERIRKELIEFLVGKRIIGNDLEGVNIDKTLVWLEKQGQKDPCEDCKHPMLNCHNFPCSKKQKYQGKSALEAAKEEKVDNANKVERKFHEGNWIVFNGLTLLVNKVAQGYYKTVSIGGVYNSYNWDIENVARLWTIDDAKDGDILTFNNNVCTMGIIICKSPTSYDTKSYCRLIDEHFIGKEESGWDSRLLVPATKEQRELLFSKMKEAGYEWDSEKKELRKIEQKLAEKVEPRFKVGDFIVNNNSKDVYQVTEIRDDEYCLWPLYAEIMGYLRINDVDNEYHLWSIKDAKDGDVLVYNNIATEIIMLFRCKAINKPRAYTHFHIFDNDFRVNGCCACGNDARPATKEQRNHLFQKIKEVGYKWDSNTKELKKIETINIPFNAKDSELIEATYFIPEGFHAEIEDGKVIIKKGEQKSSWSKEDKRIMSAISQLLKDCESENGWNCVYSNDREVFFVDIEK